MCIFLHTERKKPVGRHRSKVAEEVREGVRAWGEAVVGENVILNQGLRTAQCLHPGGQLRDRDPLRTGKGNLPQTPLSSDEPQTQNSWFNILNNDFLSQSL